MQPLKISSYTMTSALGEGNNNTLYMLNSLQTGLSPCDFPGAHLETYIGEVASLKDYSLVPHLHEYDCRNNKLAQLGLQQDGFLDRVQQVKGKYGANRVGVFVGTSTSGIEQTEQAYRQRKSDGSLPENYYYASTQNVHSLGSFVQQYLGLFGPCYTVSTACSSSAKVFASADRMIKADLIDAAVVGGVDTLCLSTLYGFASLELIANEICKPCDKNRSGLNIGEAAGFAIVENISDMKINEGELLLSGYGESSDAYHMSSPHPEGLGAYLAMEQALDRAQLSASDIDYINLHGTATEINDRIESQAIDKLFDNQVLCGSTKGWTGHTLGAAGIVEAVISCLSLSEGFIPANLNALEIDPQIMINVTKDNVNQQPKHILSNSFGFGGNNCSLIVSRG